MSGLFRKVGGTFILKIIGLGLAFIFQVFIGRVLEAELYGQYTMLLTYVNIFSIISILGMDRNLIKEIPRASKKYSDQYLKFALKISIYIGIVLSIFSIVFNDELGIPKEYVTIFIIMLFAKVIIGILDGFLQGKGLIIHVTFLSVLLNNILKIGIFTVLYYFDVNLLNAAIYSFIISEILVLFIRIIKTNKLLDNKLISKAKLDKDLQISFIKYSMTVALISGISILLQSVDKIMISKLLGLEDVGVYKVSQNYVSLISVFIAPFIAFWPYISKLYNEGKNKEIETQMKNIISIVTYLVIPMFFIFVYLNRGLLEIFGHEYVSSKASLVLLILSFAHLIDAISGPIGSILTMTKYAKLIMFNTIISLILNVVFNFIFIKMFGIIGAALGTGISIIANNVLAIIEVKLKLNIFPYGYSHFLQILYLCLLNGITSNVIYNTLIIKNNVLNIIVFSLILYFVNCLALILIKRKEIIFFMRKKLSKSDK